MKKRAATVGTKGPAARRTVEVTILDAADAVQFQACANSWGRRARESQRTAVDTLASLGITTASGKLTKRYL